MKAKIEGIQFLNSEACIVRVSYDGASLNLSVTNISTLEEEVKAKLRKHTALQRVKKNASAEWVGKEIEV